MKTDLKYERILNLFNQLTEGKIIRKSEEALRYGVTERSIQRDIDSLRSYFANCVSDGDTRKEIIYDAGKKGFRLVSKENSLLDSREIYAVIKILLGSKGLVKEEMAPLLEKLLGFCNDEDDYKTLKALTANEMLNYTGPSHGKEILGKIWTVTESVNHQRLLEIQYKKLQSTELVQRIVKPVGIMFSEYYFYMLAYINWENDNGKEQKNPTVYRIDRIESLKMKKEHFSVTYSKKFDESDFREHAPFMFGGEMKRLKFWYGGPSLEAVLDKIPTAKVVEEKDGKYLLTAEVLGDGAEMWLRGQGENIQFYDN